MFKNILLPTDGTDFSRKAALAAAAFAKGSGAKITAFYAIASAPAAWYDAGVADPQVFEQMAIKQGNQYLGEIKSLCADAGVECDMVSELSDVPYQAIIDAAEKSGCDLIFMASHGRRGLSNIFLGDATNKVANQSKISVLIYRV